MYSVASYGNTRRMLSEDEIKRCLGSNTRLINRFNKGNINANITFGNDICVPGEMVAGAYVKGLISFIKYVELMFNLQSHPATEVVICEEGGDAVIYAKVDGLLRPLFKVDRENELWVLADRILLTEPVVNILLGKYGKVVKWATSVKIPLNRVVITSEFNFLCSAYLNSRPVNGCFVGFKDSLVSQEDGDNLVVGKTGVSGEYILTIVL